MFRRSPPSMLTPTNRTPPCTIPPSTISPSTTPRSSNGRRRSSRENPTVRDRPATWRRDVPSPGADGHGTLSALFFSDNVIDIGRAKAMCGRCALQADCLAGALEREEPWGVWGGELLSGGRIIANKRPCGRPPKHPRPEMVIDELGPVETAVAVA